jgi:hypothetical protein
MSKRKAKAPVVTAPAPTGISGVDIKNKYVVLKEHSNLSVERRVLLCKGGFGCHPQSLGSAVFAERVVEGREWRWDRYDIERLATDEEVAAAKKFFKKWGFDGVCKKYERGLKLLFSVERGGKVFRVLKDKRNPIYHVFTYARIDDKWDGTDRAIADDRTDLVLEELSDRMNGK